MYFHWCSWWLPPLKPQIMEPKLVSITDIWVRNVSDFLPLFYRGDSSNLCNTDWICAYQFGVYICSCNDPWFNNSLSDLRLDLNRGSFQTGWLSPIARWSQLINFKVVFPDVSSFSFSVQYFFMVEFTRFFHFGFGVHEFLAAHRFPVFFLYCRKRFLYCHNWGPTYNPTVR